MHSREAIEFSGDRSHTTHGDATVDACRYPGALISDTAWVWITASDFYYLQYYFLSCSIIEIARFTSSIDIADISLRINSNKRLKSRVDLSI